LTRHPQIIVVILFCFDLFALSIQIEILSLNIGLVPTGMKESAGRQNLHILIKIVFHTWTDTRRSLAVVCLLTCQYFSLNVARSEGTNCNNRAVMAILFHLHLSFRIDTGCPLELEILLDLF
jgi:hypothetical protein